MRLFTYHLKAHTISNKLVSKVFAQKKRGGGGGGGSYDSSNMCSNFGLVSGIVPSLKGLPSFAAIFKLELYHNCWGSLVSSNRSP